jgi:hypothetical protein
VNGKFVALIIDDQLIPTRIQQIKPPLCIADPDPRVVGHSQRRIVMLVIADAKVQRFLLYFQ